MSAGYDAMPSSSSIPDTSQTVEKLRAEINTILSDKSITGDLTAAQTKITELQLMVEVLKNKNIQVSKENERLSAMIEKVKSTEQNTEPINKMVATKDAFGAKINKSTNLTLDNLQVLANMSTDFLEKETSRAAETEKLSGFLTVKNNNSTDGVSELMLVVTQPDGKVLQTSNWENGVFNTNAGKQIYSKKLRFNNNSGEVKKLNFSLEAEKYLPGKYIIEVYYYGSVIGRTTKVLS